MTMKLASSPSKNSSITTRAPPALWLTPSVLSNSMKSTASWASCSVMATTTPFPAASPSALTTMGEPLASMYWCAASASVNVSNSAVGMRCRCIKALLKALELSNWAAAWVGPKIRKPLSRNTSTTPAAKGASGPTTVRPIFFSMAKAQSWWISVMGTFWRRLSLAVPALPGAT